MEREKLNRYPVSTGEAVSWSGAFRDAPANHVGDSFRLNESGSGEGQASVRVGTDPHLHSGGEIDDEDLTWWVGENFESPVFEAGGKRVFTGGYGCGHGYLLGRVSSWFQ